MDLVEGYRQVYRVVKNGYRKLLESCELCNQSVHSPVVGTNGRVAAPCWRNGSARHWGRVGGTCGGTRAVCLGPWTLRTMSARELRRINGREKDH